MVKVVIDNAKGLVQRAGSGFEIANSALGAGMMGIAKSAATSGIDTGAHDLELNITQPAGTVLTDLGVVATEATVGSANIDVKVGTADDGVELCLGKAFVSSNVAAVGSMISTAATGEGAAVLAWVADSALYTATERTVYIRAEISATLTAGTLQSWASFLKL
jgi:hypothetical protein